VVPEPNRSGDDLLDAAELQKLVHRPSFPLRKPGSKPQRRQRVVEARSLPR
jgi:hypothetical protein